MFADANTRALCAVRLGRGSLILFPFLLRTLPRDLAPSAKAKDIVNPYGYGGAFGWNTTSAEAAEFWDRFTIWAAAEKVVSEFVRFSVFREAVVPYPGEVHVQQSNVVRTLDLDEQAMWHAFEQKVRKNVNRARALGVRIELDDDGRELDAFLRIYAATMARRSASDTYYFGREFFERIHRDLAGQFMYFHARLDGVIVSTELVLISAENVYSFLGGTDSATFAARPNDLLKYEIIQWARRQRKRAFVLGGGYEPGDGIFRYKASFAPDGIVPFSVGHRILDGVAYGELVARRAARAAALGECWSPRPDYFPAYRA